MLRTLDRSANCYTTLASPHRSLGYLTNLEPRHAYRGSASSTKDNPSRLLSEGREIYVNGMLYLTGADVNDMPDTFESRGCSKQVHDMCGHGRHLV